MNLAGFHRCKAKILAGKKFAGVAAAKSAEAIQKVEKVG